MRWTLDYPEDLTFLRALAGECDLIQMLRWQDIAAVIGKNPHLRSLNQNRRDGDRPGSHSVTAATSP